MQRLKPGVVYLAPQLPLKTKKDYFLDRKHKLNFLSVYFFKINSFTLEDGLSFVHLS